jgi:hypothetical protein
MPHCFFYNTIFITRSGQLVPTPEDVAESEREQKELALYRQLFEFY